MRTIAFAALLAAGILPCTASAQVVLEQGSTTPRISVTITRSTRVIADRAVMYLAVEGTGETAPDAASRNEKKTQAVLDALRPLNARVDGPIPFGTSPVPMMNSYPGMAQQPQVVARTVLRVPITKLSQASAIAAAAIAAGATSAPIVMFESSAADSVRRGLYVEAVAASRAEAEALASAMGVNIGSATDATVNAVPSGIYTGYFNNIFQRGYDGGPQASPDVTVNTTVTVRFPVMGRR